MDLRVAIRYLQVFEMFFKPVPREFGTLFECSRLLKKMSRAGHDRELLLTAQFGEGLSIQFDNLTVIASDDQESRCFDSRQRGAGKIGPPAARNHRADHRRSLRGSHK